MEFCSYETIYFFVKYLVSHDLLGVDIEDVTCFCTNRVWVFGNVLCFHCHSNSYTMQEPPRLGDAIDMV